MLLIPAIDLLGGKVARLYKGDMTDYKIYSQNPVDTAKSFIDMGVARLHIVDLDGAKTGGAVNYDSIEKIASLGDIQIEAGGGIRDIARVDKYFSAGVSFVILGTAVVKDKDFTRQALTKYPRRIVLGVDAENGKAAVSGWYEDSGIDAAGLIAEYRGYEAESVIYTDISKDGTLTGLNIKETLNIASKSPFPVIASGGVASAQDLHLLCEAKHPQIIGCIIGKAYYEGLIDLPAELNRSI
ncbi:MAG: 1-(5-phosphoribosyl)-5-[(5-phosphoribosylamino)methylideneamino]imidazole-4-carboxamide isomerase [Deferribacteraceae bacterium]|nr:1-(5-phosphoribosyl)-5-[(5-phosphoribosylamino)methylideneamino]imidazole-4-carboxamide isomerase [Deferribacteraceae bacterium]